MKNNFLESAKLCCVNGRRLLDEANLLEFEKPSSTRCYLSMIAQEEFAKAFLLYLVMAEALTWTPFLLRATRDHQCKQLLGIILDYLSPDTEEFLQRMNMWMKEKIPLQLPASVIDSINFLRHEKVRRWESNLWFWVEDPTYDKTVLKVADGRRDRDKQRSLYVELDGNGKVAITPEKVTDIQANEEYERGRRFEQCVSGLIEGGTDSAWDIERIEEYFNVLFSQRNAFIRSEAK